MTVRQAATALGVSTSLIYSLCTAGKIRHERLGLKRGTIRISAEALEEYRKLCTITPQVTPVSVPALPFCELDGNRLARAWWK